VLQNVARHGLEGARSVDHRSGRAQTSAGGTPELRIAPASFGCAPATSLSFDAEPANAHYPSARLAGGFDAWARRGRAARAKGGSKVAVDWWKDGPSNSQGGAMNPPRVPYRKGRRMRRLLVIGMLFAGALCVMPGQANADIPTCLTIQAWYPYAYATYGVNYFYYQTGQGDGADLGPSETQRNMDENLNPNESPTSWDPAEFLDYETKITVVSGLGSNPPRPYVGGYAGNYFVAYGTSPIGAPRWIDNFKSCFGL
jgi:hypothetical protein